MPLVRGIRLFNAIESGSLNAASLQALLAADAGRVSEFNGVLNSNGFSRRVVLSDTMTTAIAGSALAAEAFLDSPIAINNLLSYPTHITKFQQVSGVPETLVTYYLNNFSFKQVTLPSSRQWNGLAFGNGTFVATAGWNTGTSDMAYSTDYGKTWTLGSMPVAAIWHSVTYGNGRFVAVAGFSSAQNNAAYSTDGITWTAATLPSSAPWSNVVYDSGNDRFVAIAGGMSSSSVSAYSTDGGATWVAGGSRSPSQAWRACDYDPVSGKVIAVGAFNTTNASVTTSSDGATTWSSFTGSGLGSVNHGVAIANGLGKIVTAAGNDAATGTQLYQSTNGGSSWVTPPSGNFAGSVKRYGADAIGGLFVFTRFSNTDIDLTTDNFQTLTTKTISGSSHPFSNVKIGGGAIVLIAGGDFSSTVAFTNAA